MAMLPVLEMQPGVCPKTSLPVIWSPLSSSNPPCHETSYPLRCGDPFFRRMPGLSLGTFPADSPACLLPSSFLSANYWPDHLYTGFVPRRKSREQRPRRQRTTFSSEQTVHLEFEYRRHEYVTRSRRLELAELLSLTEAQIKIWFQNRRAKDKRIEKAHADHQVRRLNIGMWALERGYDQTSAMVPLWRSHQSLQTNWRMDDCQKDLKSDVTKADNSPGLRFSP